MRGKMSEFQRFWDSYWDWLNFILILEIVYSVRQLFKSKFSINGLVFGLIILYYPSHHELAHRIIAFWIANLKFALILTFLMWYFPLFINFPGNWIIVHAILSIFGDKEHILESNSTIGISDYFLEIGIGVHFGTVGVTENLLYWHSGGLCLWLEFVLMGWFYVRLGVVV